MVLCFENINFAKQFLQISESFKTKIMEIIIGIVIGLAIGFFVGKLMEAKKAGEEKTQLVAKAQVLQANIEQSNQHHASEVQSLKAQMEN